MRHIFLSLLLLLSACSTKNYEQTKTKLLTLKTKQFRFSDIAYLRHTKEDLELELFMAGQVFKKIKINHLVCVSDEGCMSKNSFNTEFLSKDYPRDILQRILLGEAIFEGKNIRRNRDGFEQHIFSKQYDISYKVDTKEIYFKDRKNHILIKIKELQ